MADSIQISTQTLTETAKKIRDINGILDEKLGEINKNMMDLEATWKSEAATEIRNAMTAMNPRFEEYRAVVESYAKFLDNTAQSYESTERAIQTNASAFK